MKKTAWLLLVLFTAALALSGCAPAQDGAPQEQGSRVDSLKTMGDVLALDCEEHQTAFYETVILSAFGLDGTYYRVSAPITPETFEAVMALEYADPDYEEKYTALVSDIRIDRIEDLADKMLTPDERKALVGRTGQDLLDAGWYGTGYNLETMEFWMNYDPFVYTVVFDGKVAEEDYDSFDETEDIRDLKIKSVEFLMLGEATALEGE